MAKETTNTTIPFPNFQIDKIPNVKVKSIRFQNYKAFDNTTFDFVDKEGKIKDFVCFIGPMGSGKSTLLYTVQLLFSNFEGYESSRIENNLSKSIRHVEDKKKSRSNFKITAKILVDGKESTLIIDKTGFKKKHPESIKTLLYRLCYLSRLDQDLNKFQLKRDRWPKFKELFESVTGYTIEEYANPFFDSSDDPHLAELLKNYVLDFLVKKPYETIHLKECSDGEKKIIKSFSTMLNLDYTPPIILIDNFEMHVHRFRHMALMDALRKCYPESQIFSTTHSHSISKALGHNAGVFDMRLLRANDLVKKEPWRLKIIDEMDDCIIKLKAVESIPTLITEAKKIQDLCYAPINDLEKFREMLTRFLGKVNELFVGDICTGK
jgi:predicted ATP-binding protein involved in virulence